MLIASELIICVSSTVGCLKHPQTSSNRSLSCFLVAISAYREIFIRALCLKALSVLRLCEITEITVVCSVL